MPKARHQRPHEMAMVHAATQILDERDQTGTHQTRLSRRREATTTRRDIIGPREKAELKGDKNEEITLHLVLVV